MFQTFVNREPAPAVEGDFASSNPRASVLQLVPGGNKVAPGQSVRVGYFAWAGQDGLVYSSAAAAGAGAIVGFVGRQANTPSVVITAFLGESRMTLEAGMPCTLFEAGEFYASLPGVAANAAIYATAATGAPTTTAGGNTATKFKTLSAVPADAVTDAATTIAADTGIMTVAVVASGVIEIGQRVTGAGVPDDTFIVRQLTGVAGGAGTYQTNSLNRDAVAAFTATMTQGTLGKISSWI